MGQVTVCVHGRNYRMACRDGEEKRVVELAAFIEKHASDIRGDLKLVREDKLFLMAALMIADELWETRDELQRALRHLTELGVYEPEEAPQPAPRVTRANGVAARLARLEPKLRTPA